MEPAGCESMWITSMSTSGLLGGLVRTELVVLLDGGGTYVCMSNVNTDTWVPHPLAAYLFLFALVVE